MSDQIKIGEWIERVTYEQAAIREAHLRAIVKPRPWWLPRSLWHGLLRRLLYIEERTDYLTEEETK